MLSIRFDDDHEWWVPSHIFERLFLSALDHCRFSIGVREWQHVADANGGLSLADVEPDVARDLAAGLCTEAVAELARLTSVDPQTEDGSYKASLQKLLTATAGWTVDPGERA